LYWPVASVVAVRLRSIKAGLDASTITPGSTPPLVSLTTPAIALCAHAGVPHVANHNTKMMPRTTILRMAASLMPQCSRFGRIHTNRPAVQASRAWRPKL
jgi:hypothetical protein